MDCARDKMKILVKTLESWSAHALSTFSGTSSGQAAFRVFTDLRTRLTSCSCTVSTQAPVVGGGVSKLGVFTSERTKKKFSSLASEASVLVEGLLLPYSL